MSTEIPDETISWVERLHAVVDELAASVAASHGASLRCRRGCADCCVDDLSVFTIEAAVIERHHADLLANAEAHAEGACAFLDESGACRIYAHRPYVCRTQGLPLRWLEREGDEAVEVRDVCPLNADGVALEELEADRLWTLGPFEERLAARQAELDGEELERVRLRDLFARGSRDGRRRLPVVG